MALLCLGSGALLDAAIGPYEGKGSDEQSLLRAMLDALQSGDILLGDEKPDWMSQYEYNQAPGTLRGPDPNA